MNLQIINKVNLINIILIFVILLFNIKSNSSENRIIFKINDSVFTSLDLEKRLEYLDFVGNNNNIDISIITDDFISANLFYEYYQNLDIKDNYESKINEIYENILDTNNQNNKKYNYDIDKISILDNIKIDYIRKIILENILNSSLNNLNTSKEEIDLLYNITIKYISLKANNINKLKKGLNNLQTINFEKVKSFLKVNNYEYFTKEKEINDINKIDERVRKNILSNNNFFIIERNSSISLIFIEKNFETLEGVIANLFSVKTKIQLDDKYLNCNNLLDLINNQNIIQKEYNMKDLNNELKNKLININDYVKYNSSDEYVYVVLCNIKFDKEVLNNINFNKIINLNVSEIEKKFINKYSKNYNLIKYNE